MAGKSSTAKALVNRLQTEGVAVELLKETTTRPKRKSDYSNPEYHFVSDEEYNRKDFLVSVDFNVASGEVWRYGIENQEFPGLGIIVSNMYAVDYLLTHPLPEDLEIVIIYLKVTKNVILRRDKGDRLTQKGDDVLKRIQRDINNYNKLYKKHKENILVIDIDCRSDFGLEWVVDIAHELIYF